MIIAPSAFLISFLLSTVHALPMGHHDTRLAPRQSRDNGALNSTQSVQTFQTSNTTVGAMTQLCTITLSPITDNNGQPAVLEVQNCTVKAANGPGTGSSSSGSSSSISSTTRQISPPATSSFVVPSTTLSATISTPPPSIPTSSVQTTSSSSPTASPPSPAGSVSAAGIGIGGIFTTVPAIPSISTSPPTPIATPTSTSVATTSSTTVTSPANGFSTIVPSTSILTTISPSTSSAQPTSAAENITVTPSAAAAATTASSQAAFTIPGKKLSVLPIGLAVFAGISVIALIVVGLVTYERTKYRKAFRQRKLEEAGSLNP